MSSADEDLSCERQNAGQEAKKRRIQRACDTCRRKKIRCDGGQMLNSRCSNCIACNQACTYVEAAKKRGPPKGYVEALENRLERMEKLLQRLFPDTDFTQELGPHIDRDSWIAGMSGTRAPITSTTVDCTVMKQALRLTNPFLASAVTGNDASSPSLDHPEDIVPSEDECGEDTTLAEGLRRIAIDEPMDRRFHGKSSGFLLVRTALDLKSEMGGSKESMKRALLASRRPEFWSPRPWERITEELVVHYHYPPDDLIPSLVDSYFNYGNAFMPLLHRPTFEHALQEKRHFSNVGFGSVLMLVCAIGSRWSDDPRCTYDGVTLHSAGWKWFDQVKILRRNSSPPRLSDLQVVVLSAHFLHGSTSPQSAWNLVGIGLRLAQDVGAHRRKVYDASLNVEAELWKRAFWVLVAMDRFGAACFGRSCAVQDEDFDVEFPLEVDDEYWEHPDPSQAFKQPPGRPSYVSFFISLLRLNQILAFALRTIYTINKSKLLLGFFGPQWEQRIVAELDSALNKWIDTVPDHLRWDPHNKHILFFKQSAVLYTTYYHVQILVHRPFISSHRLSSPLGYPSLAICTNAARSSSHITDALHRRCDIPILFVQINAFSSAIVLLFHIWGAQKAGISVDTEKHMEDVHKCINALRGIEDRVIVAGQLCDVLRLLTCVGDMNVDQISSPPSSNKRERESDSPESNLSSGTRDSSGPSTPRSIANADPNSPARPVSGTKGVFSVSSQTSYSSGSFPGAAAGGLPYDTAHLARAHPELMFAGVASDSAAGGAAGTQDAAGVGSAASMMAVPPAWGFATGDTVGVAATMPSGGLQAQAPLTSMTPSVFAAHPPSNAVPIASNAAIATNTTYFDLVGVTHPQQTYNQHMMGHGFVNPFNSADVPALGKGYEQASGTVYDQPSLLPYIIPGHGRGHDAAGTTTVGYEQLNTGMASVDEALQMWSSAPASFDGVGLGSTGHGHGNVGGVVGQEVAPGGGPAS